MMISIHGIIYYLSLTVAYMLMTCLSSISSETADKVANLCPPERKTLVCPDNEVIVVISARYNKIAACPRFRDDGDCVVDDPMGFMSVRCFKKNSCSITNEDFEAHRNQPCEGAAIKPLVVKYNCVPERLITEMCVSNAMINGRIMEAGFVTSPNYPLSYEKDQSCSQQIMGSQGQVIRISLLDIQLEDHPHPDLDTCYDQLVLMQRDSQGVESQTYCQSGPKSLDEIDTRLSFNLTRNEYIEASFESTSRGHNRGFLFKYEVIGCALSGIPKAPDHGRVQMVVLNDKAIYACDPGFAFDTPGDPTVYCQGNSWRGTPVHCIPEDPNASRPPSSSTSSTFSMSSTQSSSSTTTTSSGSGASTFSTQRISPSTRSTTKISLPGAVTTTTSSTLSSQGSTLSRSSTQSTAMPKTPTTTATPMTIVTTTTNSQNSQPTISTTTGFQISQSTPTTTTSNSQNGQSITSTTTNQNTPIKTTPLIYTLLTLSRGPQLGPITTTSTVTPPNQSTLQSTLSAAPSKSIDQSTSPPSPTQAPSLSSKRPSSFLTPRNPSVSVPQEATGQTNQMSSTSASPGFIGVTNNGGNPFRPEQPGALPPRTSIGIGIGVGGALAILVILLVILLFVKCRKSRRPNSPYSKRGLDTLRPSAHACGSIPSMYAGISLEYPKSRINPDGGYVNESFTPESSGYSVDSAMYEAPRKSDSATSSPSSRSVTLDSFHDEIFDSGTFLLAHEAAISYIDSSNRTELMTIHEELDGGSFLSRDSSVSRATAETSVAVPPGQVRNMMRPCSLQDTKNPKFKSRKTKVDYPLFKVDSTGNLENYLESRRVSV